MWPFTRKKADQVGETVDAAIALAAERWRDFESKSNLPDNINLRDRVRFFAAAFKNSLAAELPAMEAAPHEVLLLVICKGIEKSGRLSRQQIERQLGVVLPPG